jgi:predicted GH43/DUF377 family glycosyl hydrolase
MTWRKLGLVHRAAGERPWQQSHAYCPTALELEDRLRVLCAFLDGDKVGRLGFVDVDTADPRRVLEVSAEPALDVGVPGCFDDNGVTPLSVLRLADGRVRLYYAGWQLGVRVRYLLFTGAAESTDDGRSFRRVSQVPVLDRSDGELSVRSSGFVLQDDGGYRMWYAGGSDWVTAADGTVRPAYAMRHARSADGLAWPARGELCMTLRDGEHGFARPAVVRDGGTLRMWYSVRHTERGYRLGYATSADGLDWERRDEQAGLDVSPEGWDSEMVGLACVIDSRHGRYLFYNGNGYGESGFGVAVDDG